MVFADDRGVTTFSSRGSRLICNDSSETPTWPRPRAARCCSRVCARSITTGSIFPAPGRLIPRLINGWLYSVNPIALITRPTIFWENKRIVTAIDTPSLGQVQFVEIGATMVGSVRQTYMLRDMVVGKDRRDILPSAARVWRFCSRKIECSLTPTCWKIQLGALRLMPVSANGWAKRLAKRDRMRVNFSASRVESVLDLGRI